MRFLLTFLVDRAALPDPEQSNKIFEEMVAFVGELEAADQLLFSSQVLPEPAPVQVGSAEAGLTTSEAKDDPALGGFFVITAANHAEALAIAKRCPHRHVGPTELRALNESGRNARAQAQ